MNKELFDGKFQLHHETDKALLVSDNGDEARAKWLPKSQVETNSKTSEGIVDLTMPVWLAKDKGFI